MAETDTKTKGVPLWVKLLLVMSLALNLAVIGLVGGFFMRTKERGPGPGAVNYALPYIASLKHEDRKAIGDALRLKADSGQIMGRRSRVADYREMARLLRADTLDVEGVEALLERQQNAAQGRQTAAQGAWVAIVTGYSLEERLAYSERLETFIERGRKGRKDSKDRK